MSIKDNWISYIHDLQNRICAAVEAADGKAKFLEDAWQRPEGGGGKTRVIVNGAVFEKGGVNTSVVFGHVTDAMRSQLKIEGDQWWACGLSLVLHPVNPFVPTVHCNYRMFELYKNDNAPQSKPRSEVWPSPSTTLLERGPGGEVIDRWFGGGTDLTPYYLIEADAKYFHQTYKKVCDSFDAAFYAEMKKTCDDYFVNTHRNNERRGIGGIFYDYKRDPAPLPPRGGVPATQAQPVEDTVKNGETSQTEPRSDASANAPLGGRGAGWAAFGQACGDAFIEAYLPIVDKRKDTPYTAAHKYWQEIRRGRYVEFNLVHDRGTLFGLKTNGRIESILMSLPPTVRFEYNHQPVAGSEEDKLLQACLHPKDWV